MVGGVDFGLVDGDGHFNPDVVYLLQSSDGCTVLVRERGHAPNVFMLFETASKKLDYLNDVVAYGQASQVSGGLSVNVFKVRSACSLSSRSCNSISSGVRTASVASPRKQC